MLINMDSLNLKMMERKNTITDQRQHRMVMTLTLVPTKSCHRHIHVYILQLQSVDSLRRRVMYSVNRPKSNQVPDAGALIISSDP